MRVEAMLTKFLREHQRDGLQFLFDCVTGRKAHEFEGLGWCATSCRAYIDQSAATPELNDGSTIAFM